MMTMTQIIIKKEEEEEEEIITNNPCLVSPQQAIPFNLIHVHTELLISDSS